MDLVFLSEILNFVFQSEIVGLINLRWELDLVFLSEILNLVFLSEIVGLINLS